MAAFKYAPKKQAKKACFLRNFHEINRYLKHSVQLILLKYTGWPEELFRVGVSCIYSDPRQLFWSPCMAIKSSNKTVVEIYFLRRTLVRINSDLQQSKLPLCLLNTLRLFSNDGSWLFLRKSMEIFISWLIQTIAQKLRHKDNVKGLLRLTRQTNSAHSI